VKKLPALIGGSADLTGSTLTRFDGDVDYQKETPQGILKSLYCCLLTIFLFLIGRYLRFGVREHAMAALANGLVAYHPKGALIPHIATFLNFLQ
jgi:transketolase